MNDGPRGTASALIGVRRLLKFDLQAWNYFDKTLHGFWMSFIPAFVLAPFLFAHMIAQFYAGTSKLGVVTFLIIRGLAYVISWTLFPFAMLYVIQLLQRTPRYFWHMVPYNWLQLPLGLVLYSVFLLADAHIVPVSVATYMQLTALVMTAVYGTFIAGIGLQVATGTALSLVVLDLVINMVSEQLIARI